ncbi:pantoate--beta-alanine ligase [Victivallis sp. Marseille-Q1083]|uniref:pantoate--beta-alanine ligase n=1 Tax=Victivallis sp. Marseille-Q1083 TaxID=2717288 RepID=UPI001589B142|nr:pantoate--beta-alanine ligase [Victivallis sp. Marseille-Q1083]
MEIFKTVSEMQQFALAARRAGRTIAVVPTMGYLHAGHFSLIDRAVAEADLVIVTIFVNPTQFGPNEDLDKYPRDFERDVVNCEAHGATAVFAPSPEAMYCPDHSVWVAEETLSRELCGRTRPVHFRGVTTVVTKLFNITQAEIAVFGRKDAQQALIIQRMVRDLNMPVRIIVAPLVRDADQLALSSRNRYLSPEERSRALSISRSLLAAEAKLKGAGPALAEAAAAEVAAEIAANGGRIDYVSALDADTLQPVTPATRRLLLAVAAYFGATRLIDNIYLEF